MERVLKPHEWIHAALLLGGFGFRQNQPDSYFSSSEGFGCRLVTLCSFDKMKLSAIIILLTKGEKMEISLLRLSDAGFC